jgi:hypothetical protein
VPGVWIGHVAAVAMNERQEVIEMHMPPGDAVLLRIFSATATNIIRCT